jgi:outer membrane protein TolC
MVMNRGGLGLAVAMLGLAGCAGYRAEPLRPTVEIERLDQRSAEAVAPEVKGAQEALGLPGYHPEDGLDEAELVMVALSFNPDLRSRRYAMSGLIGRNSLFGMVRFRPEMKVGIDSATVGLVADSNTLYTLLVPSLRTAWNDENEARRLQARAEMLVAEGQVVLETRRAHVAVLAATDRLGIVEEHGRRLTAFAEEVRRDAQVPSRERALVEVARQEAAADIRRAGDLLARARFRLNLLLGFPSDQPLRLTAAGQPLVAGRAPVPARVEIDRLVMAGRWELKILEAEYRHAEYQLSQAVMGQYPRLHVAPAVTYDRELGTSFSLGAGVRLPWPQQAAEQAESARVGRDRARAAYVARLHELRSTAHDAYDRVERAWSNLAALNEGVAASGAARGEFAQAWARREVGVHDLLAVGARLDDDELARCDAGRDYRLAGIDLDHATGRLNANPAGPATEP